MLHSRRGSCRPLGSTLVDEGVNFAVYAPQAKTLSLCLFDNSGHSEVARIEMFFHEGGIWSVFVSPLTVGCLYGYRADGDYNPQKGKLFNVNKLLLDPYAKDLHGEFTWSERHFCHMPVGTLSHLDNAIDMPKSKVVDVPKYEGTKPNVPWSRTVIYECHVKGATFRHPEISESKRGTFLALAEPAFISHLQFLGVTTLELLPVHAFVSEQFLTTKGLTNYWGYNTLNYFTPHKAYLRSGDVSEFQETVKRLHEAGIEVILDVVYNHTAEAGVDGPVLSFKGLNNKGYYRSVAQHPDVYINDTGCGNTLNIDDPYTLLLVLDSLRYWVEVMGVDGFRFDLASILARNADGFNRCHTFLQAVLQDPILQGAKLIAEPWDIGPGGYQLGAFPVPWREWNDKYRDTLRRFWLGEQGVLPELAKRVHGSHDLFEHNLRGPLSSINFITSHDGFTLADWVSYEYKHNEANGEQNRDGHSANHSMNCGQEGFSTDPEITSLRLQMQKNALLTLFLSKGVPMIAAGSEFGHSQGGNNNAYCQDNRSNWLAWKSSQFNHSLTFFIKELVALRRQFSAFSHPFYIHANDSRFSVRWLNESGEAMSPQQWHEEPRRWLIYTLLDKQQQQALLIILNASTELLHLTLPEPPFTQHWQLAISSCKADKTFTNSVAISPQSSWVFTSVKEGITHG
ncbi:MULTISPECIES: glycogen debranching protein GlgX [Pseudoalteromonas]|uniref:Glycogen debranching enzyme GlgX n=1 Tax=Pseudoalteromonas amylolytica TaxID=1859457 RepID=A0A1S1N111_9GAMM|nr:MULTISPECIES: glycogen debranching protein GlgX [Pseudoalteromonas]OHU85399.1 glycogen debranching enzyme GlgX [Pseudoalteromonas sp. JW3]OHU92980.1 glycogen debranching enzyme GlgX [Pseudoalteromonas amylolytica]